jgi:hypothetical protein
MQRTLRLVEVNAGEDSKCLTIEYGGRKVPIHLEILEPMRALGKWLVSDADLKQLFGTELKPYHASLIAELAGRFSASEGAALPIHVDIERLEAAMASGRPVHIALTEQ